MLSRLLKVLILITFVSADAGYAQEQGANGVRFGLDGLKYVRIPAGQFLMGCSADDDYCQDWEKPAHLVSISKSFWLGQTEVTQSAYEKIKGNNPSKHFGADFPVETVTWTEALAYCQAVAGRLPTEAEWEYAVRAGRAEELYGDLDRIAWHFRNSGVVEGGHLAYQETHEVGLKQPNQWGLYDMIGNVAEWVADWDGRYHSVHSVIDPKGATSGLGRVVRGGGFNVAVDKPFRFEVRGTPPVLHAVGARSPLRASGRSMVEPEAKRSYIGFRCALP